MYFSRYRSPKLALWANLMSQLSSKRLGSNIYAADDVSIVLMHTVAHLHAHQAS